MLLKGSNKTFPRHLRCRHFNKMQNSRIFSQSVVIGTFQISETGKSNLKLNSVKYILKMNTCHATHM